MKLRTTSVLTALAGVLLASCCLLATAASAGALFEGAGEITAPAEGDSIEIDERFYLAAPAAPVLNGQGRRAFLADLPVGARVRFDYEYTAEGAMILRLWELPR